MNIFTQSNIGVFRVECAVCKSRRNLRPVEISDCYNFGFYEEYQFCTDACKERASDNQAELVNRSKIQYRKDNK